MSYQLRPAQPPEQQRERGYDEHDTYSTSSYGQQACPHMQIGQQPEMMRVQSQSLTPVPHPQTAAVVLPIYHDGFAHTQMWIANQPSVASSPAIAKAPSSEWIGASKNIFDRRTLRNYPPAIPPRPRKAGPRICGIPRSLFFIIMAVGLFGFIVAVAVGLGVGLGTRSTTISDSTAQYRGDIPSSSTPTMTTPTAPTKVSPTPNFTGTLVTGLILCPENNNTVYVSQGSSKPFNVQCGRDYNSDMGAQDIAHIYTSNMADCIDACGERIGCVGVGWGYSFGSYQCWMKSKLGEPNSSPQWYFAQLQDMNLA